MTTRRLMAAPPAADERFLFVDVTKQCNVYCTRCYLFEENRARPGLMAPATLRALLLHPLFQDRSLKQLRVIYQGGEPTLAGPALMQEFVATAQAATPWALQGMVTNMLNFHPWLVEIAHAAFGSRLETTFALDQRMTLDRNRDRYLEKFTRAIKAYIAAGLHVAVNYELNRETFLLGPDATAALMVEIGRCDWVLDYSVNFHHFNAAPSYNRLTYPELTGSLTHAEFVSFVRELHARHAPRLEAAGTHVVNFSMYTDRQPLFFNSLAEASFTTVNPDGTITTNPLFADMAPTYLGRIGEAGWEEFHLNPDWAARVVHEHRRKRPCLACPHHDACGGGSSHAPLLDGSGECAGGLGLWAYFAERRAASSARPLVAADA